MSHSKILLGDVRSRLQDVTSASVRTCVTSPPYYGLRDYGNDGQIGLEASVDAYVAELVGVCRDVRRVLTDDGTLWLNLGDSYSGTGNKGGGSEKQNSNARGVRSPGRWVDSPVRHHLGEA
jgi:DNA modification methylase